MHPLITIVGNVGSGKSRLAAFVAKALNAHLLAADELYKINPFFHDAVLDRRRWSLTSDLWFLIKRIEMIEAVNPILKKRPVVQDSGLLMSWVYAHSRLAAGYMDRREQNLYNLLYRTLTKQIVHENLIIYLNLPTPILLDRIKTRGRDFEIKHFTKKYIYGLHYSLHALIKVLHKKGNHIVEVTQKEVNSEQSHAKIITIIKNHLNLSL